MQSNNHNIQTSIDLNCDMGESIDGSSLTRDAQIMPWISSCNIACGYHSGTPEVMRQTIRHARDAGVAVGAHPSYKDAEGFGRRFIELTGDELRDIIIKQIMLLANIAAQENIPLHHVKPHGALYNHLAADPESADVFTETIQENFPDVIIYGLSGSELERACQHMNHPFYAEVFADRRYEPDGRLRSRQYPDAVLHKTTDVVEQLRSLVLNGIIPTSELTNIKVNAHTVCLHSDTQDAISLAETIHQFLIQHNVRITHTV